MDDAVRTKKATLNFLIDTTSRALIPVCRHVLDETMEHVRNACPNPCTCGQTCFHPVVNGGREPGKCLACKRLAHPSCTACQVRFASLRALHDKGKKNLSLGHSNASQWLNEPLEVLRLFVSPIVQVKSYISLETADASIIFGFLSTIKQVDASVRKRADEARKLRNDVIHMSVGISESRDISADTTCDILTGLLLSVAAVETSFADTMIETRDELVATAAAAHDHFHSSSRPSRGFGAAIDARRMRQQQYVGAVRQFLLDTQSNRLGPDRSLMKLQFVDILGAGRGDHVEICGDVTQTLVQRARTESVGVLLLSGDAGSGKSACVRAVAEQLIQPPRRAAPFSSQQNQSGTFFVDLSELSGRMPVSTSINNDANALSAALLRLIISRLANFMAPHRTRDRAAFEDLFKEQIRNGRCVFLLDSFDEMSAILSGEQSTQQLHSLSAALEALGENHLVIVASRRFHRPQCQATWELELKGPREEDQRTFVNDKLLAVESLEPPLRDAVVEALFENERLREMRERPLLLSLTCDFIARRYSAGELQIDNLLPQSPHIVLSHWCKTALNECNSELDLVLLVAYACGMVAQTSGQQSWELSDLESRVRDLLIARQFYSAADKVPIALQALENPKCGILVRVTTGAAMVDSTADAGSALDDETPTRMEHRVCFWHRRLLEWFASEYLLGLSFEKLPADLLENDAWEHVVMLVLSRCAQSSSDRPDHEELLRWFLNRATLQCSTLIREHGEVQVADSSDEELCRQLRHILGSEPCHCERHETEEIRFPSRWQRLCSTTATCLWRVRASVASWCTLRPHFELLPVHNAYTDDGEYDVDGAPVVKNEGVDESARAKWMEACNYILYSFSCVARNGVPAHACDDFARFQRAALELAVCASRHGDWRCVDVLLNSTGVLNASATEIVLAAALENPFFYERAIAKVARWEMLRQPTFVAAIQFKIAECVPSPNAIASRPLLWIFLMRTEWYRALCEKQERERARCDDEVKRLRNWISLANPENVSPRIQQASDLMERVHGSKWHYWVWGIVVIGWLIVATVGGIMCFGNFTAVLYLAFLLLFPLLFAGSQTNIIMAALLNILVGFLFFAPMFVSFEYHQFFDMSSACGGRGSLEWVHHSDYRECSYYSPNENLKTWTGLWLSYDTSCQDIHNNTIGFQCCMYSLSNSIANVHYTSASSLNDTIFCAVTAFPNGAGATFIRLNSLVLWFAVVVAFWHEFLRVLMRGPYPSLMKGKVALFTALFGVLGLVMAVCSLSSPTIKAKSRHVNHVRLPVIILCTLCCVAVVAGSMLVAQCVLVFGLSVIAKPLVSVLGASAGVGALAMLVVTFAPLDTLDRSLFKAGGVFLRALWHTQRRWLLIAVFAAIAALSYGGFRWLSSSVSSVLELPIVHAALLCFAIACALLGSVVMLGSGALLSVIASRCSRETPLCRGPFALLEQALRCPCLEEAEREVAQFLSRDVGTLCVTGKDIVLVRQWTVQYRGRSEAIEFSLFSLQQKLYRASLL